LKISKTGLLVIAIGVVVILVAVLGRGYLQQTGEQKQINDKLVSARQSLDRVPLENLLSQKAELEQQLEKGKSESEAAKATLPEPIDGVTLVSDLIQFAQAQGMEIVEVSSPGVAEEQVGDSTFPAVLLTVTVKGEINSLFSFATKLNSLTVTSLVKSFTLTDPDMEGSDNATARIELAVYNYPKE
jgi:hypothetical protein